jgi:recombinational DNA repair protein (RecF pathway)
LPQVLDRALLLRRFAYGESSLVVQALTREHGRLHLIAKGAYRPTSRFYAALDLFDTLELTWSHQRGRDLQPLAGARILVRRQRIARSTAAFRAAASVLELATAAAREGQQERELQGLVEHALDALDRRHRAPVLVQVEFELAFLQNLGLAPALGHCAACGRPAPVGARRGAPAVRGRRPTGTRTAFSASAGGRLCRACAEEARGAGRRVGTLPLDVLDFARQLTEAGESGAEERVSEELAEGGCDAAGLERVHDFVARFLEFHLEARPKSLHGLLASANRNAPRPAGGGSR